LSVWKVQTSCGYGVPIVLGGGGKEGEIWEDRETMGHWAGKKIESGEMREYRVEWNTRSLDGLVALTAARRDKGEWLWCGDVMAWVRRQSTQREGLMFGVVIGAVMVFLVRNVQSFLLSLRI